MALLLCGCNQVPNVVPPHPLSLPNPTLLDDSENAVRQTLQNDALRLLASKDYAGLDKLATRYREMASPFATGSQPIIGFYDGILENPEPSTVEGYKQQKADLDAWVQASPDSVPAKIAQAIELTNEAWFARGGGYADTVTDKGWDVFGQRLNEAAARLDSVKDKRQDYPEWYYAHNSIGMGLSEDKATFLATALEGTTHYPQAATIYSGVETYLMPRWFGSYKEMGDYVTQSADKIGGDEGDILYARLARFVWCYSYDTNPFSDVGLSWPRVKSGMELIVNRYPHSTRMASFFCLFAWLAKDHDTAHVLFNHLGDRYDDSTWNSRENFEKARAWAQ